MKSLQLKRIAVSPEGRRETAAPILDDDVAVGFLAAGFLPLLDHAGPAAASWSVDRPLGPGAVKESQSGRLPLVLDDAGWDRVQQAFVDAAVLCRRHGMRPIVSVDDDGLLHAAVSPLMCHPPMPDRVAAIVSACAPCDVLVVVEDLAPGGLDPTAGVALCKRLIACAQATTLYATSGTVRLAPLKNRGKGTSVDVDGAFLFSAAWCTGLGIPVIAVGASAAPYDRLVRKARMLELAGVVVVDFDGPAPIDRSGFPAIRIA
ncbi:MAG: hypothetical protein Q8O67_27040 [Deltaproteobacteria bacterium]|nr:hypothetical protein [Deltaproteobacteria bacterium]